MAPDKRMLHGQHKLRCSPPQLLFPCSPMPLQYTMRVLQGGIIGSALIALGLALLGIFYWLLQ